MQKAHLHLIKYALAQNNVISVWDGGEWQVRRSDSYKDIKEAIESVEEAEIRIYDKEGNSQGWALIIPHGMEPDEIVADHTCNDYFDKWSEQYEKDNPYKY